MTHRERVLRTFRFQETDRVAYDLMEGAVWPELLSYFKATRGCAESLDVLDYLDTDCRWLWMIDNAPPPKQPQEMQQANGNATCSKRVARGPLADARAVADIESYAWPDPARWVPPDFAQARQRWPDHALVFIPVGGRCSGEPARPLAWRLR